jgi:hypothetical protein
MKLPLSDPRHPAWSFGRTLIVLAIFGGLVFAQAQKPDWTEGRLMLQAVLAFLLAQAGHEYAKARVSKQETDQ